MADVLVVGARESLQRAWLFAHVAESRAAGRSVVLFVPEQFTLQAERDLMTSLRLPGLLNLDVISPTKLKSLIRERAGSVGLPFLDEAGRAMAIHRALQDCGKDLVCYRRLGNLYGAVARVDRTLSELREEGLVPGQVEAVLPSLKSRSQRLKYQDLCRIWRSCDELLEGRFEEPSAAWRDVCSRLEASGLWQGADLYLYGFDTLRPDLRELVTAAAGVCASVRVLLTASPASSPSGHVFRVQRDSVAGLNAALEERGLACRMEFLHPEKESLRNPIRFLEEYLFSGHPAQFPEDPDPFISLYAAPHPTAEALAAVSALRAWHAEGIPWNRMAIALPRDASGAESLLAALRRHHIPYFRNEGRKLARHGVSRLLSGALACVAGGYDTEPLLEIARSGFGSLSREEGDLLASYARTWGIRRSRWRQPFSRGENAPAAETLRQKLLSPLDRLHAALVQAPDAGAGVEAVFRFLLEEDIYAQLQLRQQEFVGQERYAEAVLDRQVWNQLMKLLDQLYSLLNGRRASLKEISLLLSGALDRAVLSALPEDEEGVAVGQIGHMLPGQTDALILPGIHDGTLHADAETLLSDGERKVLEENLRHSVGLSQVRLGLLARSDFIRTMSLPSRHLWVSWSLRDESGKTRQPGEPVTELRRLFPALREQGGMKSEEVPPVPAVPSLALEGLATLLRGMASGTAGIPSLPWQEAIRFLLQNGETAALSGRMLSFLMAEKRSRQIESATAVRLFRGDRVSISRLECYAGCPFQHFLRYGLRPLLPRDFEFTPGDAGNFFHLALERYADRAVTDPAWPRLEDQRVQDLIGAVLEDLTLPWEEGPLREDSMGRWQGEAYLRRIRHAASVLTRFAANSDFRILGTEMEFGTPGGMPPVILRLSDGSEAALQGKIDRLDLYRGPGGDYLRILDLKSSEKQLEPARMLRGEQLQLMIYLQAALRCREGAKPAGALYFPIQDREVNADSPEDAERNRLKEVQFSGVALEDPDVLRAMDRDQSPYSLPKIWNKDGSLAKSASWVLPPELLRRLMDAAVEKAAELCGLIRSGGIQPSPSVSQDGKRSVCTFCEFSSVCLREKEDERPLPENVSYADVGSSGTA